MSSDNWNRRDFLLASCIVTSLATPAHAGVSPKLAVFLQVDMPVLELQKILGRHLPGVAVQAYSRRKDLGESVQQWADGVLALAPVLGALRIPVVSQGLATRAPSEPYVLLSTTQISPTEVSSVGFVDILGRRETTHFVHSILGSDPRIRQVSKLDDLLPLLQLGMAQTILVPGRLAATLMSRTRIRLVTITVPTLVPLPAFGAVTGAGAQLAAAVRKLPSTVSQRFGVEEWK
jgi:hypothetical protein